MIKCHNCGNSISDEECFCPACGQPVMKQCPKCGMMCDLEDIFCRKCAYNFSTSPKPIEQTLIPQPVEPSKIQQVPMKPQLHSKSFKGKEMGIRKHATILFADIKGSTAMIERLDPEEAVAVLTPTIDKMLSAIYQYNGTVIHTTGDGLVAIFGAPQALEDHALLACLASLKMQSLIQSKDNSLQIRIGLNTGEILLETIGGQQYFEYDITGAAVNLAARME